MGPRRKDGVSLWEFDHDGPPYPTNEKVCPPAVSPLTRTPDSARAGPNHRWCVVVPAASSVPVGVLVHLHLEGELLGRWGGEDLFLGCHRILPRLFRTWEWHTANNLYAI